MPEPVIHPCGGQGQPACPPTPATITARDIVLAYHALSPAEREQAELEPIEIDETPQP